MQNELYRLTFCENVLKIALGTQPRRPELGSEGFPGGGLFLRSGGRPGKNDVMRCCVVVDREWAVFCTGGGRRTGCVSCFWCGWIQIRFPSLRK